MNKRKNIFRIIAIVLCLVFAAGVGTDFRANAATPEITYVSDKNALLSAVKNAKTGDIILVSGVIEIDELVAENEGVILSRHSKDSYITTTPGLIPLLRI